MRRKIKPMNDMKLIDEIRREMRKAYNIDNDDKLDEALKEGRIHLFSMNCKGNISNIIVEIPVSFSKRLIRNKG